MQIYGYAVFVPPRPYYAVTTKTLFYPLTRFAGALPEGEPYEL